MPQMFKRISIRTVVSFLASAIFCSIAVALLFAFSPNTMDLQSNPECIALIIAGILISFLFSLTVQCTFELKHLREYFENMAIVDVLTNLYNRRYIDENINRLVKSVTRSNGILTLMVIDLDFFKNYNEAYGHGKGDICLKTVAGVLSKNLKRDNDFVARYGGEEFVLILPNTDENGAGIIAEKLLSNIRECRIPHEKSDVAEYVTVSIGAVTGGGNYTQSGDDYIGKAYDAMHMSKQNGRNRYTIMKM